MLLGGRRIANLLSEVRRRRAAARDGPRRRPPARALHSPSFRFEGESCRGNHIRSARARARARAAMLSEHFCEPSDFDPSNSLYPGNCDRIRWSQVMTALNRILDVWPEQNSSQCSDVCTIAESPREQRCRRRLWSLWLVALMGNSGCGTSHLD